MQRSRKALLQRRASETAISGRKHHLYKVSLSLVVVLWALVFLLNLWISHGDGHTDGSEVPVDGSTWSDAELGPYNKSYSGVVSYAIVGSKESDLNALKTSSETELSSTKLPLIQENGNNLSFKEECAEVESPSSRVEPEKDTQESEQLFHAAEMEHPGLWAKLGKDTPKSEKLSRIAPVGLDEFKSKASSPKGKTATGHVGIIHRLETGGEEYNYASASKGAKILAFNKESKGASNILGKDMDKYLRNPCSAEEKFVVVELSEETLVDTIEIANFEHYSSNLKDFELLGSMVYPTDGWLSLGNFTAGNVKHAQRFVLQDPQWVRYLKLNLLNHYGSEFYCTLSALQVYGVDAVERMLEDLISAQDQTDKSNKLTAEQIPKVTEPELTLGDESYQDLDMEVDNAIEAENPYMKTESPKSNFGNVASEARPQQVGRMPGDTVLKILMQKVRSLDMNLSILERYLEELNSRYGDIFKEFDNEIAAIDAIVEKIKSDMKSFAEAKEVIANDVGDLVLWKSLVSLQMENLARDNAILRSEVERVLDNQGHMESKGLAVFVVSFIFMCFAAAKLFIDLVVGVFRIQKSGEFCGMSSQSLLLMSCTLVIIILLL